ncbi:MAG: TetR/AcrR family transcriptional regulator [Hydrogenophaga sp.]|jgi:TetR/AcrR family transcriptional regulator, lmrAB and yxaGH operons repressor|uniref:TetR/AcrR family transcriptional regulator n=1 Tax=Hydrogenophaga sp. TaxID=1904254 RepID=UPI0027448426|nr:TetR/AcrR family transcriptional regulator [Hydrogenophaga sp.]MDP3836001.1 TetR/AcrR family transcriptional regulator [Hydrogenophaga sp.]MDZ4400297.1 TetR/AcrR family transcriptional regulator [Hydrogenophaga sp.]
MADTSNPAPTPGTRERLIAAMTDALRRRGLHGIGLTELLAQAGAPKGVLYHHFPGGKAELAAAAIDDVVARMLRGLDTLLATTPDPIEATRRWMAGATARLSDTGFESGCPLATVALETTPDDRLLRSALDAAFARLRERIARALEQAGEPHESAQGIAALIVATYEGGLLQARVAQSTAPIAQATQTLLRLLAQRPTGARP